MPTVFLAVSLAGAVMSLAGAACLAALPAPNFHWYNRLAIFLFMGFCASWVFLTVLVLTVNLSRRAFPRVEAGIAGIAFLLIGISTASVLLSALVTVPIEFPDAETQAPRRARGVYLMPIGALVQAAPSLYYLIGAIG